MELNFPIAYDSLALGIYDSEQSPLNFTRGIIQVCEITNKKANLFAWFLCDLHVPPQAVVY